MMPPYDVAGKMARLADRVRGQKTGRIPALVVLIDPNRTTCPIQLAGGLRRGTALVYRHFGAADRFEIGHALARISNKRGLLFLVSADLELADATGADGIHWPEKWLPLAAHRRARGDKRVFTASAHSPLAARAAATAGVDTVIYSPVFASASPSAGQPKGVHAVASVARSCATGLHALGGINLRTGARLIGLGLSGIACVGAVLDN